MWYLKAIYDPNKHPLMPDDYPYMVYGEQVENSIEITEDDLVTLRNTFDLTAYLAAIKPIPKTVTPRQIRTALVLSGFSLSAIDGAIDTLSEPTRSVTRIAWEYSIEFQRDNPLIMSMAPMLNLTALQIDNLFLFASTL